MAEPIYNVSAVVFIVAKDCLLTLEKSSLALGSPSWLFVTILKMTQYTGKWLLTAR